VAQKHGVNANQVFQWRRLYRDDKLGSSRPNAMKLLPIIVAADEEFAASEPARQLHRDPGRFRSSCRARFVISLEGSVDPAMVRAVLRSLRS
jgi:transposase